MTPHISLSELTGARVEAIRLDSAVTLAMGEIRGEHWEHTLRLEKPFSVTRTRTDHRIVFDPFSDESPRGMDEIARLVLRVVTSAVAYKDGALRLEFSDGPTLMAPGSDDEYEAWTLTGPSGTLVSTPGGGLG